MNKYAELMLKVVEEIYQMENSEDPYGTFYGLAKQLEVAAAELEQMEAQENDK